MNEHVGDDAELYALGVLDDAERERIDAHLAQCAPCSRAVGEAEAVALALVELGKDEPRAAAARSLRRDARNPLEATYAKIATAAALILLAVSAQLGIQNVRNAQTTHEDDVALATLATSHFLHASFTPRATHVAPAKAIYARDGAWTYVIVDGDAEGWHVYGDAGGVRQDVATLHAHGRTSTAFAQTGRRFDALELRGTGGDTLATVTLAYPKPAP